MSTSYTELHCWHIAPEQSIHTLPLPNGNRPDCNNLVPNRKTPVCAGDRWQHNLFCLLCWREVGTSFANMSHIALSSLKLSWISTFRIPYRSALKVFSGASQCRRYYYNTNQSHCRVATPFPQWAQAPPRSASQSVSAFGNRTRSQPRLRDCSKGLGCYPNKQKLRFPATPGIAVLSICIYKCTACQVAYPHRILPFAPKTERSVCVTKTAEFSSLSRP